MQGFDDTQGFQLGDKFRGLVALQLNAGEWNSREYAADFVGRGIDEKRDGHHEWGQSGDDLGGLPDGDATGGCGVEYNSHGVGPGLCGRAGIFGTADSTDFYLGSGHGKMVIEKRWTRNWREMMAASHFLAFDLGAESGRAILGTLDGTNLSLAEKHRFSNPNGKMLGRLQWNLLAQWEELKTGLRKTSVDSAENWRASGWIRGGWISG